MPFFFWPLACLPTLPTILSLQFYSRKILDHRRTYNNCESGVVSLTVSTAHLFSVVVLLEEPGSMEFSDSSGFPLTGTHSSTSYLAGLHRSFQILVPSLLWLKESAEVVKRWTANWRQKSPITSVVWMGPTWLRCVWIYRVPLSMRYYMKWLKCVWCVRNGFSEDLNSQKRWMFGDKRMECNFLYYERFFHAPGLPLGLWVVR